MKYLSVTFIIILIFACYVINTIWTLAEIFLPPKCSRGERCFSSYLSVHPVQNLVLYISLNEYPIDSVKKVHVERDFDCRKPATFDVEVNVPLKTRSNGSLYMHAVLLEDNRLYKSFSELQKLDSVHTLPLVVHVEPQAATFNLLQQTVGQKANMLPYAHIFTQVPFAILTDDLNLPANKLPGELYPYMKVRNGMFLPIIQHNVLKSRIKDLQLLNKTTTKATIKVSVSPVSYGSLRLALHVKLALDQLYALGFSEKDVDDVKGIFADTNLYILSATMLIASVHLLFDFLSFKHDVSFWRGKTSLAGLSTRTVLWRAFSQSVIFLYLLEEKTSMLVLIPAGISAVIELWKISKVMHLRVSFVNCKPRITRDCSAAANERSTVEADAEAMKYLSMLLYPLCFAGAVYTLAYESHKGWYSWLLSSLVNGVYAFGFLFMLPQLFVNYRLRSVAALPWRAFMYKAFNTFIDDIFAFIVTMPTVHRVACFRDDLVFLVYLYQRWLYPVDPNRTDSATSMDESPEEPQPTVREKTD